MPCSPGGRFFTSTFTSTAPPLPGRKVMVPASAPSAVWIATTTGFTFAAPATIAVAVISTAKLNIRSSCMFLLRTVSQCISLLCARSYRLHTGTSRRGFHCEQVVESIEIVEQAARCHQLDDLPLTEVCLQV